MSFVLTQRYSRAAAVREFREIGSTMATDTATTAAQFPEPSTRYPL